MRLTKILQRYVVRDFAKTFALALTVLSLIFLLATSLQVVRKFKMLEIATMLEVVPYLLLVSLSLTLPISVLAACTLTYSRLAHDNEITAMRACGIHLNQVIWPVMVVAGVLAVVAFGLGDHVVPRARVARKALYVQAVDMVLAQAVSEEPKVIEVSGLRIGYRRASRDGEEMVFDDMVIHIRNGNRLVQEIMAEQGRLRVGGSAVLALSRGSMATIQNRRLPGVVQPTWQIDDKRWIVWVIENETRDARWVGFEEYTVDLRGPDPNAYRPPRPKECTVAELRTNIALTAEREDWKKHRRFVTELYKRYNLPLACLVVVLLGIPLGILVRHSNKLVSFAISAVPVLGVYYPLMMLGEAMGESGRMAPALAMGIPNIVVGLIGMALLALLYRR